MIGRFALPILEDAIEYFIVTFLDEDGDWLDSQIVASGEDATPPTPPAHPGKEFDSWVGDYTGVTADVQITALYTIESVHTYVFISLTGLTSPVIYLNKADTGTMNIYNDADDTLLATSSASGNISPTLALGSTGEFCIRIESAGTFKIGQTTEATRIFSNTTYSTILRKLYIGSMVTMINNYGCRDCIYLSDLKFTVDSLTTIRGSAFFGCTGLTGTLTIPDSVTLVDADAFYGCTGLTGALTLSSSMTAVSSTSFSGCTGLTAISIPSSITVINSSAFVGCICLTGITIPSSVTTLGSSSFSGCTGLIGTLTIPDTVTSVRSGAFSGCAGLSGLVLSTSLTSISSLSFYNCTGLTGTVTIPSSITSIGDAAFRNCSNASLVIWMESAIPPTLGGTYVFDGTHANMLIKVPSAAVATYQAATYWAEYAAKIVSQ